MNEVDMYTYRVAWSAEDREFVGMCAEFPGLSWLDASAEKALAGIRKVVADCLHDMSRTGEAPPKPGVDANRLVAHE